MLLDSSIQIQIRHDTFEQNVQHMSIFQERHILTFLNIKTQKISTSFSFIGESNTSPQGHNKGEVLMTLTELITMKSVKNHKGNEMLRHKRKNS